MGERIFSAGYVLATASLAAYAVSAAVIMTLLLAFNRALSIDLLAIFVLSFLVGLATMLAGSLLAHWQATRR